MPIFSSAAITQASRKPYESAKLMPSTRVCGT